MTLNKKLLDQHSFLNLIHSQSFHLLHSKKKKKNIKSTTFPNISQPLLEILLSIQHVKAQQQQNQQQRTKEGPLINRHRSFG